MREINWDEIFQRRPEQPAAEDARSGAMPWEDWITLGIVIIAYMAVVHSIVRADWVDDLPSLYPIGLTGLLIGYGLSKVRISEWLLHPLALLAGATLTYLQLIAIVPGGTLAARTDALVDRMYVWWSAVTQEGISTDPLPFIVIMVAMIWLGAYVSAWGFFRWRNPWLGLVPGGTALMWNISFIPGQFSYAFVIFIFAAVLLLMRMHVARREEEWLRQGVRYPEFLSLSVLHGTFWLTVLMLILVWLFPLAERSESANERWSDFTSPLTERLAPFGRVFVSVNAKKPIAVHNFKDALPFQGKITLSGRETVQVDVEITAEMAAFLRAQSFDEYTASGWRINIEGDVPLAPGERAESAPADNATRRDVTVNVTITGSANDDVLYSLGQPAFASRSAEAGIAGDESDVVRLTPDGRLGKGDTYSVTGSVAAATVDQLRAAGDEYPDWVTESYLQVPRDLPLRVERKAEEVAGEAATPYDTAVAIERYLRTFPNDFNVRPTPPGRDTVDYFLFDVQRGYFDYHASAMAVMLRTLGVPARVATGYVVDPLARQGEGTTYALTEKNAFAWPEVYFPGSGWVEFSPTPSEPLINRPGAAAAPGDDNPAGRQANLEPEPPIDLGIDPGIATLPDAGAGDGYGAWPAIIALTIAGLTVVMLAAGGRFAWEYGLSGLPRPAQIWEKTLRLARWSSAGARPSETPREFAARLRDGIAPADDVAVVAAAYERTRFGQKALSEEEAERLESAWESVRNVLVRRLVRRRR